MGWGPRIINLLYRCTSDRATSVHLTRSAASLEVKVTVKRQYRYRCNIHLLRGGKYVPCKLFTPTQNHFNEKSHAEYANYRHHYYYTVSQKSSPSFCHNLNQILTDFQNSFTDALHEICINNVIIKDLTTPQTRRYNTL